MSIRPVFVRLPGGVRSKVLIPSSWIGGTKMARQFLGCGLLLLALQVTAQGDDKKGGALPPAPTNPGLEKMKKLAGTWVAADQDGKPTDQVVSIIKLTAEAVRFTKPCSPASHWR
jgi:hypothetical protein